MSKTSFCIIAHRLGTVNSYRVFFYILINHQRTIKRIQKIEATNPTGYLIKPFENRELAIIVEAALYRNEMQETVKTSQRSFRALIDNSADAVVIVRSGGTIHAQDNIPKGSLFVLKLKAAFKTPHRRHENV